MRVSIRPIRSHIYTHTHMRARGLCVYHCTVLTHTITEARIRRHVRLTLRTRIPMSPGCMCAGILDREHLLMLPRPPANQAFSNARNGISEVFSAVIAFLAKSSRGRLSAHFSHISSHTYLLFSSREKTDATGWFTKFSILTSRLACENQICGFFICIWCN